MLISFPIGLLKLASCIIRNEMHTKNAHKKLGEAIKAAGKWSAEKAGEQADPTVSLETAGRKLGETAYGAEGEQVQFAMVNPGSHYDYSKPFAEQVEDWEAGRIPAQDSLVVGRTPEIFKKIGMSNLPMTMDQRHIDYAVNGTKEDHQTSKEFLAHLPELLEDPIAIIESVSRPNDSVVVLVDATINGKQTVVPITIQTESEVNGVRIDANHIASAYGKDNAVRLFENAIKKEKTDDIGIYYVDKNRASVLISGPGLQLPDDSNQDGLIHSIFDAGSPVNRKYLEQTETRQFKRWFGDSKVVDEDGKPRIVYHGTDSEFNVFDMTKGRANMDIQGAFFSPYEDDAAGYVTKCRCILPEHQESCGREHGI